MYVDYNFLLNYKKFRFTSPTHSLMRKSDKNRNSFKLFHSTSTLNLPRYSISDINNKQVKDGEFFYLVSLMKQEIIKQKNLGVIGWKEAKWNEIYTASAIPFTNGYDHKLSTCTLGYLLENKELFPSKFKSKKVIYSRDRKQKLGFVRKSQFIDLEEFENDLVLLVKGENVQPEIEPRFIQIGAFYNFKNEVQLKDSIEVNKKTIQAYLNSFGKQKKKILQLAFAGYERATIKQKFIDEGMSSKVFANHIYEINRTLRERFQSKSYNYRFFSEKYRILLNEEELTRYFS